MLLPIAIPLALLANLLPLKKTVDRTPDDVIGFIEDFIDGTGGDWDWDEFESVPITDARLDALREEASMTGPPYDVEKLRAIVARVKALKAA